MAYQLNRIDKENISRLYEISKTIWKNYLKLLELEEVGKYDTESYQEILKELNYQISIENQILNITVGNFEKNKALLEYLDSFYKISASNKSFWVCHMAINYSERTLLPLRLRNKLIQICLKDKEGFLQSTINEENDDSISDILHSSLVFNFSFCADLANIFILLTSHFKALYKYYFSFLIGKCESYYLEKQFSIPAYVSLFSTFDKSYLQLEDDEYEAIVGYNAVGITKTIVNFLLSFNDKHLKNERVLVDVTLQQKLLHSLLVFLDDSRIKEVAEAIKTILYNSDLNGKKEICRIISQTFEGIDFDKELIIKVFLGYE